ncbi:hypothetical protein RD792_007437 [Penstemon davidsonii]|uniref:Sugar phosphate transporter domain-containing protein n=1 Tax=Penstemon davidsonii TaxID=160366 RepID=A0ABR0D6F2_9LAMI|nr:hypothetical protein RD792_007437 [Penstemon davidsonii]
MVSFIRSSGFTISRSLQISNAKRIWIREYGHHEGIKFFRIIARIQSIDVDDMWEAHCVNFRGLCVSSFDKVVCLTCEYVVKANFRFHVRLTVADGSGTMNLKLYDDQAKYIFRNQAVYLKKLQDQQNGIKMLRERVFSLLHRAFTFIIPVPPKFARPHFCVVKFVLIVDWSEECSHLPKRRHTLGLKKHPSLSINGSDFLQSRKEFLPRRHLPVLPPLTAVKSRRSSVLSLSKPLHITKVESFSSISKEKERSLLTCKAYEADRSEPIEEAAAAAAVEPSEAARKVKIGIYFATWWGLNVIFNIYNKKVLNAYPFPWLTSTLSLAAGSLIMLVTWALRIAEPPKTDLDFWKTLFPVAVAHTIGHVAATVSMSKVAVSFTHIIKSGEPAFSVLVSSFILGESFPPSVYLSLLPIIGGCGLAALTELNFNMIGFMGAMISNLAFVFRNIFSKKGMKGKSVSGMNYYACLSMLSLVILTPFAFAVEGPQLWAAGLKEAMSQIGPQIICPWNFLVLSGKAVKIEEVVIQYEEFVTGIEAASRMTVVRMVLCDNFAIEEGETLFRTLDRNNIIFACGVIVRDLEVADGSGTMNLKLYDDQAKYIFRNQAVYLKKLQDQQNGIKMLRERVFSLLHRAFTFIIPVPPKFARPHFCVVKFVLIVDWSEECSHLPKRRHTLGLKKHPSLSINGSDFLQSRKEFLPRRHLPVLPPLTAVKSRRSSVLSLSKPLHITKVESFSSISKEKERSLLTCKAYEADRSEPIEEAAAAAAVEPSEAARKVKIGIYFATWWGLNVIFNIYNKKVLNAYPFPWLTSTLSLAAGSLIMLVTWALRIAEPPKTDLDFWKTLFPVAVAHTIGHVAATVSMSKVAVSFTHIIKSGEPAFSVLVSSFILGESFPPSVYLSLLPIIGGCGLAALTELNFNMIGFMGAMISNLAFVFRNIFSKKGMKGKSVSGMNYYACLSMLSLVILTPFAFAVEGPQLWAAGLKEAMSQIGPQIICPWNFLVLSGKAVKIEEVVIQYEEFVTGIEAASRNFIERIGTQELKKGFFKSFGDRQDSDIDATDEALSHLEAIIRGCYKDVDLDLLGNEDFMKIMLLDGCFIVELLMSHDSNGNTTCVGNMAASISCYLAAKSSQN